jgi:hypothetical protein
MNAEMGEKETEYSPTSITLDESLKAKAKMRARENRQSFSGYVNWLIDQDLKRATESKG